MHVSNISIVFSSTLSLRYKKTCSLSQQRLLKVFSCYFEPPLRLRSSSRWTNKGWRATVRLSCCSTRIFLFKAKTAGEKGCARLAVHHKHWIIAHCVCTVVNQYTNTTNETDFCLDTALNTV